MPDSRAKLSTSDGLTRGLGVSVSAPRRSSEEAHEEWCEDCGEVKQGASRLQKD